MDTTGSVRVPNLGIVSSFRVEIEDIAKRETYTC